MPDRPPQILEPGGTEVSTSAGGARFYRKPLKAFRWKDLWDLLCESFSAWNRHKGARLGASLAFYTLLSLTPLLLVAVFLGGLIFGEIAAEGQIVHQIQGVIGPQGAAGVQALLAGTRNVRHGVLATGVGLLTLLFGASGVLLELRDALNTIWEVRPAQSTGLRTILQVVKERLFSFALVLAVGFLLIVSLVVNAWIAAAGRFFSQMLPAPELVLELANVIFSLIVTTGLFAAIYKVLPDVDIEWGDVLLGSFVTSLLFNLGKLLIGLYLGKASFASTYGAAASVVILILWVYYSGQVFYFGAEFTSVFATRYTSHTNAPRVTPAQGDGRRSAAATTQKLIVPGAHST